MRRRMRGRPSAEKPALNALELGQGVVTGLAPDTKRPDCVAVEIEGKRLGIVLSSTAAQLKIEKGAAPDEETLEKLIEALEAERTYTVALNLLSGRSRSVNELLWRLRDRGHNPKAAAHAVGRLEAAGLLDDYRFSVNFARVKAGKGNGRIRIVSDLMGKGVDKEIAERAVDEALQDEEVDPIEQARELATKRAEQLGDIPAHAKRRRLLGFLGRRGFRGYDVAEIVDGLVEVSERQEV